MPIKIPTHQEYQEAKNTLRIMNGIVFKDLTPEQTKEVNDLISTINYYNRIHKNVSKLNFEKTH